MAEIMTLGEIMLRLSPKGHRRFVQAGEFDIVYGGGEANVAMALSNFGMDAGFISKIPSHEIGQAAVNELRKYGVSTSAIVRGGARLGIYFLEMGAAQRPAKVVYDRAGSAFALADPAEFCWNKILAGTKWLHFSGITPALGENAKQISFDACKAARDKGIIVSCDLNYRKNLWSLEEAGCVMKELMPYVDVLIANQEQVKSLFGMQAVSAEIKETEVDYSGCQSLCAQLRETWPQLQKIVLSLRGSVSGDDNYFGACYDDGAGFYHAKNYLIHMVDRVGSGDAFSAGIIYAIMNEFPAQEAIEFAVASGVLKHSIEGDVSVEGVEEVKALAGGDGSGKVQR
ncbi:MAG: sugar kinase [Massilimaliae sp.]|nr:sugar kinase [Massiliimalia sp.]